MKGDFSRDTFDSEKHYSRVLMQQGRVQLDADWNEQQFITQQRAEITARDVIGLIGAPRIEAGFRVSTTGANLSISAGHFYVDGLLCEKESDSLITAQNDLPGFALPANDGIYLAYLEAWERHESMAEQPALRETALGGADTATRVRTVSQVKLLPLPTTGTAATCGGSVQEWDDLLAARAPSLANAGRLSARTAPEGVTSDPACLLPPSAGFKGLENQLYRVEIHLGGDRSTARFKWSRENGSVVTPVTDIAGLVVSVETTGRDDKLAFATNDWVELSDDTLDLTQQRGALFRVGDVSPANRQITLLGGPLPALDPNGHRVFRRWDQSSGDATGDGQPLGSADFITLEQGIQVHFEPGTYNAGDYWLIPARSAVSIDTGQIEWPVDSASVPLAVPSQGNRHHFARLGIFQRTAGTWTALAADCRPVFPPLTAITAADVAFDNQVCNFNPAARTVQAALDELCRSRHCACTILIRPGDDVAAAFAQLGPQHDAMICFQTGDYRIDNTVVVAGKGNLRVCGCGPATRLFSTRSETVLRFENCPSVTVENLAADGGATNTTNRNGALTFVDCHFVGVHHCAVSSRGFGQLRATCITARNGINVSPGSQARITGCDLSVGHLQAGVLLVNVDRTFVQDNFLRAGDRPGSAQLLEDRNYRSRLRRNLLTNIIFGPTVPPGSPVTNASVTFNNQTIRFRTQPTLINAWLPSIANTPPSEVNGPHALFRLLEAKAHRGLLGIATPGLHPAIRSAAQAIIADDLPAGLQGIVVGGTRAEKVQIVNNAIEHFFQGIHVGLSHAAGAGAAPDVAGHIVVADNDIRLRLSSGATLERHGIFVGNFASLDVRGNFISAERSVLGSGLRTDGIRVFGFAGPRMSLKDNHLAGLDVGAAFTTRVMTIPRLWIITHNLAANASETVRANSYIRRILHSIRSSIVGINENVP